MRKVAYYITCFCLIWAITAIGYGSFAYFKDTGGTSGTLETDIQQDNKVLITNYYDLYRYTKAGAYNDLREVSRAANRTILVLQKDLVLEEDLFVTADVHLDLNGHSLKLNDHSLIFQHGYYGSYVISNGSLLAGTGQLVMDVPHATYVLDHVDYETGAVKIMKMDELTTAYNALYQVANVLVNDVDARKERLTPAELQAKGDFTVNDLLAVREECSFSGVAENCVFVNKDIDLPYHYFSEDIVISYQSSESSVLNEYGNLLTVPENQTKVILTATVSYKDVWSKSIAFPVHVVNLDKKDVEAKLGQTLIKTCLQKYWTETDKIVQYAGEDLFRNYYWLHSGLDLPLQSDDFSLEYTYRLKDYQKQEIASISKKVGEVYRIEPNEKCFWLEINVRDNEGLVSSVDVPILCTYVTNNETVLRLMMNDLYGGSVLYDGSLPTKHLYTYAEIKGMQSSDLSGELLTQLEDYIQQYGIVDIEYTLFGDVADHYDLTDGTLRAIEDIGAYKESGIRVTATFADGTTGFIDLYVIYLTGNGDTVAGYWTYFNLYNESYVPTMLSKEFYLPFAYSADERNYSVPYTVYDVAFDYKQGIKSLDGLDTTVYYSGDSVEDRLQFAKPDGLKISLVEGDTTYVTLRYGGYSLNEGASWVAVGDTSSLSAAFNAYLTASGNTLNNLRRAQWRFEIDCPGLTLEDLSIALLYNYSFTDRGGNTVWLPYCATEGDKVYYTSLTTSTFLMEGGLICAAGATANHIPNSNLFVWMYNQLNPNGDTLTTDVVLDRFYIQNDWLTKDLAIDYPNSAPGGVTEWYGIQYLDSTTSVDLSGFAMNAATLDYVTGMDSVERLSLNNCGLTTALLSHRFDGMDQLQTLHIANNNITLFEDILVNIPNLGFVYLYGNPSANGYYGSEGISNFQSYEDLKRKGVSVYYTINNNNNPILFENSEERNDYQRLKNLEYQSVLSSSQSIETLYADFRNLTTANLRISGTITGWGYEPGKSVYDATYFYVTVTNNGAQLTVKYYVDRY